MNNNIATVQRGANSARFLCRFGFSATLQKDYFSRKKTTIDYRKTTHYYIIINILYK